MAIISVSRQIASFGDEISSELAQKMGYSFINRKMLDEDLLKHGLSEENLRKYDEKKPGFWASLARDRDQYFDYLREAVFERAKNGNCVFIGRGCFSILKDIPGTFAVRLVGSDEVRIKRLMDEFSWTEKKAQALLQESDTNRRGFHKCFFNIDHDNATNYNLVINTDTINPEQGASIIEQASSLLINQTAEHTGLVKIAQLLQAQKIINHIVFVLKMPVHFLEASTTDTEILLHGVADSSSVIERVLEVARLMAPEKKVSSGISIVQDYKSYP